MSVLDAGSISSVASPDVTEPSRSVRHRLRSALIGLTSLLVVLGAIAYVASPSEIRAELEFAEVSSPQPYDQDLLVDYNLAAASTAERARFREVIYGNLVARNGIPVRHARLVLKGVGERVRGRRAVARIGRPGTFRAVVHLKPGRYRITVVVLADDKRRSKRRVVPIRNGTSYLTSLTVRESGFITMLPISSY
ncbi:hypothetical protein BH09ACT12_BH09ACT12_36950 [soil metagenome]